jgi:SAM-dependent methyltransferase
MTAWDANAERRTQQITSGIDLSYLHVLMPAVMSSLPIPDGRAWRKVIDAGCGPGVLAKELAGEGWSVTGVDQSSAMIESARRNCKGLGNVTFVEGELTQLPALFKAGSFDAVVANMSLTGLHDTRPALRALRTALRRRGRLVIADIHPWFWRQYKGHTELSYWKTVGLVEPFTISLDPKPLPAPTPVVYRSMEDLHGAIAGAGFLVEKLMEPRPEPEIEARYPQPWAYPRFIVLAARTR